ncbi:MAG: aldehyde ferredoxin oxidoreductase family protein [Thermoplasmata archaeon]|nr:aldehyde ferredoxin oxidoreductase family protein [Thermoplasmata archaeon]
MSGLFGKLLDVDLTKGSIGDYSIPKEYAKKYIGGKGLASRILLDEFKGRDPLSHENILIFMTGPLTGLIVPGAGRHVVVTKSPLTGFYGEAYAGGFFGSELKGTGYDGIIFRGRAEEPVYLSIIDGHADISPAHDLWGKSTGETEDILKAKHEGSKVSSIGPAGENLVFFAAIINDKNRAAGRCGVGAVMGSKNLKAVAVKGNRKPRVEHAKAFEKARSEFSKTLTEPKGMKRFGQYGTSDGVESLHESGILPTKNFKHGTFDKFENITGEKLHDTIMIKRDTCTACPVRCKRVVKGQFEGHEILPEYGGPEYETVAAFGSLLSIDDLSFISLANQMCNALGLDTISTGNVIAFAMEAEEKGLLGEPEIRWRDASAAIDLIDQIALREGSGRLLADGVKRLSEKIGGEEFAIHVKGMEMPMHEPRGKKSLGISYATSPRGASHLEGLHDTMIQKTTSPELGINEPMDRLAVEGKALAAKNFEDARAFTNSLILCVFTTTMTGKDYNFPLIRVMVNGITGLEIDAEEMLRIGERNYNLGRMFAVREGLTSMDDDLPPRFKQEALPFGDRKEMISRDDLDKMLTEYYQLRGWDESGRPTKERLKELEVD